MPRRVPPTPILIHQGDAATMIGVTRDTLLRWAKKGAGGFPRPVRVVERTWLFDRRSVEEWARGPERTRPRGTGR